MKLLFDQNLSHTLVERLADCFPDSTHVRYHRMASASDPELWDYALKNDYTIVSKDDDFHHLSFLRGSPPKVIGIGIGNCSTDTIEILLRNSLPSILAFEADPQASFHRLP